MAMLYRVRDWGLHFENAQSRKVRKLNWVAVPNKHDGKSYRRLIQMQNGAALYGCWILLLEVASKCPQRGVLADGDGPLTADDIALKTGVSAALIDEALAQLSDPSIGWLEANSLAPLPVEWEHATSSAGCSGSTLPVPPIVSSLNGTEQKEQKEQKEEAAGAAGVIPIPKKSGTKTREAEPIECPAELDRPDFHAAWEQWREHRRQLKKPMTTLAESKALQQLATKGIDRALAAINHSIANGWKGIFEPTSSQERPTNGAPARDPAESARLMKEHSQQVLAEKMAEHQKRLEQQQQRRASS